MRDRGFPQRYTDKELGAMKYEILWWFSIQWVSFFLPGNAKQLICVLGDLTNTTGLRSLPMGHTSTAI